MAPQGAAPVRVLVVDDHTLFRRGLVALLSADGRFEVVGEAGDAGEALRVAAAARPDVVLLDNHLPGVAGVDALPGLPPRFSIAGHLIADTLDWLGRAGAATA